MEENETRHGIRVEAGRGGGACDPADRGGADFGCLGGDAAAATAAQRRTGSRGAARVEESSGCAAAGAERVGGAAVWAGEPGVSGRGASAVGRAGRAGAGGHAGRVGVALRRARAGGAFRWTAES